LGYYMRGLLAVALAGAFAGGASVVVNGKLDSGWVTLASLSLFVVVLLVGYLKRLATTYTISNRRLHIRRGIISLRTQEARIDRVQNVNTVQSALERILQVGTVDFDTAGLGEDHDFQFTGVADPGEVVEAVDRAQRAAAVVEGPGV